MFYLLTFFLILTVGALFIGLLAFLLQGDFNRKYANKMMRARIIFQFLALIVALGIIAIVSAGGKP